MFHFLRTEETCVLQNNIWLSKKEILTFVTTWMNLEGIILCEMSEKPKPYGTILYVK